MISINDVENISNILSMTFFYGFSHNYSENTIEECIINNHFYQQLENGDSSFLINYTDEDILGSVYERRINDKELLETNTLSFWLGDVYSKIFLRFNKSFSFIFLYLPLAKAIELFPIYHEMDFSQTLNYFEELTTRNSILSLLLKKRNISISELSLLSDINYNTIVSYTRNNEFVYNAKFDSIFRISQILDVNINIFAKNINNYVDTSIFDLEDKDPTYRLYLALFIASYFDKSIIPNDFIYQKGTLYDGEHLFIVKINKSKDKDSIYKIIKEYVDEEKDVSDTIITIFDTNNDDKDTSILKPLLDFGYDKVIVINNYYFFEISKEKLIVKEMNYLLNNGLNSVLKRKLGIINY